MRFIDKTIQLADGRRIIDDFLQSCWDGDRYVNCNFASLNRDPRRTELKDLLRAVQDNLCCYCMIEVSENSEATIEHYIPQSCGRNDHDEYRNLFGAFIPAGFVNRESFDMTQRNYTDYPHDIAFENLVVSCSYTEHCNHFRSSKRIFPVFFCPDSSNIVTYDQNGFVQTDDEGILRAIIDVNLNNTSLVSFRVIWRELSLSEGFDADNYNPDQVSLALLALIERPDFTSIVEDVINDGWPNKKFLRYNWFGRHYASIGV